MIARVHVAKTACASIFVYVLVSRNKYWIQTWRALLSNCRARSNRQMQSLDHASRIYQSDFWSRIARHLVVIVNMPQSLWPSIRWRPGQPTSIVRWKPFLGLAQFALLRCELTLRCSSAFSISVWPHGILLMRVHTMCAIAQRLIPTLLLYCRPVSLVIGG